MLRESFSYKRIRYAHNFEDAKVNQQHLPKELEGTKYYSPTDRGFEKTIPVFYLKTLSEIQDLCVKKYKKNTPVLTVDMDKTDFKNNKKDRKGLLNLIKRAL